MLLEEVCAIALENLDIFLLGRKGTPLGSGADLALAFCLTALISFKLGGLLLNSVF